MRGRDRVTRGRGALLDAPRRTRPAQALLVLLQALVASGATATSSERPQVTNVRYFVGQGYTRVVVDLTAKTEYAVGRVDEPGRIRIFFDVAEATLTKELANRSMPLEAGLLKQIRVGQHDPKTVRVVLDFTEETTMSSFMIASPYRIVIDVLGTGTPASPQAGAASSPTVALPVPEPVRPVAPPSANSNGTYSMARQLGLGVRVVVVDAGHGGTDPGCIGRSGTQEKTVTLDIAKRLKPLLEQQVGCRVVLTRDEDRFVPLEERTAIANTLKADLFLSIHVNSSRRTTTYGTETYFLNFATDERAMEVAARENAMSTKSMSELQTLVQRIALNSKIDESREVAGIIQRNLVTRMLRYNSKAKNLGVKQAPFYVLIGAQMPSVLVETNFMSQSAEEKLLRSTTYRLHVAEALLAGIKEYMGTLSKAVAPAAAAPSAR
ncbi:MAG: N-acetylmuramoyl-L-alanine amidase [Acidobacteriota bacterium]